MYKELAIAIRTSQPGKPRHPAKSTKPDRVNADVICARFLWAFDMFNSKRIGGEKALKDTKDYVSGQGKWHWHIQQFSTFPADQCAVPDEAGIIKVDNLFPSKLIARNYFQGVDVNFNRQRRLTIT